MQARIYTLALALTFAATVLAPTAHAAPAPESYATGSYLDAARVYWGRMLPGRQPPCPTTITFVDEQEMVERGWDPANAAMGDVWGCHIAIRRSFWNNYEETSVTPCTVVVHEYGHNIGLGHTTNYPIMWDFTTPPECGGPPDQGNPYLGLTTFLYQRKHHLLQAIARHRAADRCARRCKPLRQRLVRARRQIAALEGVWRR